MQRDPRVLDAYLAGANIDAAEEIALVGSNGVGKSTILKAICALVPLKQGHIVYDGADIKGVPAYKLARGGMAFVPQGRGIFGQLTVAENLAVGAYARNDKASVKSDIERVYARFPLLKERYKQSAGTLSGGEQQMVAIGRALMSRPKMLLLDEPTMGLAPIMVRKIFNVITQIARDGVTVLLVAQSAKLALQVSDRGYVMDSGSIVLTDSAAALLTNPQVRWAYMGE
ncbi:MAG: ABC transporter ATP-binding protein [Gammaproteobacteria bacterium]|nr:ABC transporter ATP-binding protein [Gammaproteobacteria bacterium]